jgi:U3 small nucleolar RNA-associated protein 13
MPSRTSIKTTFEAAKTIEPIHTGGDVSLDKSGRLLATCVEEAALIVNIETGERVFRIENDGEPITSLALSPSAAHLVICSRSLSMRIYGLNTPTPELRRTLKPHATPVITSAIDATGTLLATGGADGTVKVWDIKGGFTTHTFHGHGGVISALSFFQLAIEKTPTPRGKRKDVDGDRSVSNPSSFFLASGSEEGKIRIWNLQTRKSAVSLESHVSVVRSLAFSQQQQTLLSASRDQTMMLWDVTSWKPRKVLPVLEVVEAAGFVSDGKYCYSGGQSGKVRIWNTSSGAEVTKEQIAGGDNDSIVSIQCGPNFLLSVHLDQAIQIHALHVLEGLVLGKAIDPLQIVRRISGNHDEIIDLALVGHERSLLALATNTESVRIISIAESTDNSAFNFGADVALLSGHSEIIICLDVDWSGHWLATGAKDNSARLWRLDPSTSSYTCFATFVGHAESLGAIALPRTPPSPQAASDPLSHPPAFIITGSQDRTIKRWDPPKLKVSPTSSMPQSVSKSLYTRVAHEKDINAIDVSSTSPLFSSASQDRTIKIWELESGSVAGILRGHKRGVWSVRFAPKDSPTINTDAGGSSRGLLISGSGDRTVKLWSLNTYTCILTFEGHSNSVLKVLWLSPPPVSSSEDNDDASPSTSARIPHKTYPIIASASADTLIKLWSPYTSSTSTSTIDVSDDHLLATLDNHTDRVWALATSTTATAANTKAPSSSSPPTQKYPLISGSADSTLTFWTDTTVSTLRAATAAATARIEQDQELQNRIRARNYREVIVLALQLNHPARLLAVFEEVIHNPDGKENGYGSSKGGEDQSGAVRSRSTSISGNREVDEVLSQLSHQQLYALLCRVRDWNTNARTAAVAQRILHVILRSYPVSTFVEMARARKLGKARRKREASASASAPGTSDREGEQSDGDGDSDFSPAATIGPSNMKDLLRALEVYTERHLRRTEDLLDESYLVEYTLGCMDDVLGDAGAGAGEPMNGERKAQPQQRREEDEKRIKGVDKAGATAADGIRDRNGNEEEDDDDTVMLS